MSEFEYRWSSGSKFSGDLLVCQSCGWEAPLAEFRRRKIVDETKLICEVCANSEIGGVTDYLRDEDIGIYRSIAQCTNLILDKLTDRKQEAK